MKLPTKPIEFAYIHIAGEPAAGLRFQQFIAGVFIDLSCIAEEDRATHLHACRNGLARAYRITQGEDVTVSFDYEVEDAEPTSP